VSPSSRMAWAQPNHGCQEVGPRNPRARRKPYRPLDAHGCLWQAVRVEGGHGPSPLLLVACPPARHSFHPSVTGVLIARPHRGAGSSQSSPDGRPPKGEKRFLGFLGSGFVKGVSWGVVPPFRMACRRQPHASRGRSGFQPGLLWAADLLTRVVGLRPGHTEGRNHEAPLCSAALRLRAGGPCVRPPRTTTASRRAR